MSDSQFHLPSTSFSKVPTSFDVVLTALENGFLSTSYPVIPIKEVKEKLVDFTNLLNSTGRISMLHATSIEREELVYFLLNLKKGIKTILTELGRTRVKKPYKYICAECGENVVIEPGTNAWCTFQNHEHIEEAFANQIFCQIAATPPETMDNSVESLCPEKLGSASSLDVINENNYDCGIERVEKDISIRNYIEQTKIMELSPERKEFKEEDVNSFRFNFQLHYDEEVEAKIYPESFMTAVRKCDRINYYTILRAGNYRAVCLLCSCDLVSRAKITKAFILDHVMGQRHLRFASNPTNVGALTYFHDTWLNLDQFCQAHQLFFRPEIGSNFKCILCNEYIMANKLKTHLKADPHKRRVIELFDKNNKHFFLIELQVQLYGPEMLAAVEKRKEMEEQKKLEKENMKPRDKTESESSPSPDSKETVHQIVKSVENPDSNYVLDLLPNRFKGHLKYLKPNGNMIHCTLCRGTLPQDIETLKHHIRYSGHLKAADVGFKRYVYYCDICNIKMYDEAAWQKHFTSGPNKHALMPNSRKNIVTEYECIKCVMVIYGDDLSLIRHNAARRERKPKEIKLTDPTKKLFRTEKHLEVEAKRLTNEANDTLKHDERTQLCCNRLEQILAPVFEYCRAYPFGSRISGLGNKDSDLDLFLDTGGMYTGGKNQDSISQVQLLRKVANTMQAKHRTEYEGVYQIPTARTPIVKFYHRLTDIECDVSFRHGLSVENTKFLRFCIEIQPITQPFVLILKKWSEYNLLNEHITTYALAILAIFYLQIHKHLLTVKEIRELNPETPLVISGWETIQYTKPLSEMKTYIQPYSNSLRVLLRDFFAYYAQFKYQEDVVCPLLGKIIKKRYFLEGGQNLLPEMLTYVAQLQSDEPEPFRATSPFCIQDPFDLSHNLTKALQHGTLHKFKTLCELSYKLLDTIP